jgi:BlaI family penicillinase repressor
MVSRFDVLNNSMKELTTREEQIMQAFWLLGKAFIRDVIPELPDPKPHYNSVATIIKILEEKGFLAHETIGNVYAYYPTVPKEQYQRFAAKDFVSKYFDNNYASMLAFFAREKKITREELSEIYKIIKNRKS